MRIIAKIDYKNGYVIKGRRYEGFRKVGPVREIVDQYYNAGVREFTFYDCVAALFGMSKMLDQVVELSQRIFAPITAGGGIRNFSQAQSIFENGADRIAINTMLFDSNSLVQRISDNYGAQSIVGMLEIKKIGKEWHLFKELGREPVGLVFQDGLELCERSGIGEVNITAIDYDGLCSGFPTELCEAIPRQYSIPVVLGGGFGGLDDIERIRQFDYPWLSGVSIATLFHQDVQSVAELEEYFLKLIE